MMPMRIPANINFDYGLENKDSTDGQETIPKVLAKHKILEL